MIGQENIEKFFNNKSIYELPNSFLLVGDFGCGKKRLISELAKKYNAIIKNIDFTINNNLIDYLEDLSSLVFICIDGDKISELEQNKILKFLEERVSNVVVFITTTNYNTIIDTIKNRCQVLQFNRYDTDYLKSFLDEQRVLEQEYYLSVCNTPGKIKKFSYSYFVLLLDAVNKLLDNINKASLSNLLFLSEKFNFKKDNESLKLFVSILEKECLNRIQKNNDTLSKTILGNLMELKNSYTVLNSDLSIYFDYFILKTKVNL